jgi:hypothetical protein
MKIFSYNMQTKARGEQLGVRSVCSGHGSGETRVKGNEEWITLDQGSIAVDSQDRPITAEEYGVEAICFCIGEMFCGTDSSWNWVVVQKK